MAEELSVGLPDLLEREPVRAYMPEETLCRTCAFALQLGKCPEKQKRHTSWDGYNIVDWCEGYELAR